MRFFVAPLIVAAGWVATAAPLSAAEWSIELATLPGFTYPGDLFPPSDFFADDIAGDPVELTPRNTFMPRNRPLPPPDAGRLSRVTKLHQVVT